MKNCIFLCAAMMMTASGCGGDAQQQLAPAVSDVRSDESIEAVKQGSVLIDRSGEEIPALVNLTDVSFLEEVRKLNSFTVRINRKDFDSVRSRIYTLNHFIKEVNGEIVVREEVEASESPYIKVIFPSKVKSL